MNTEPTLNLNEGGGLEGLVLAAVVPLCYASYATLAERSVHLARRRGLALIPEPLGRGALDADHSPPAGLLRPPSSSSTHMDIEATSINMVRWRTVVPDHGGPEQGSDVVQDQPD